ncbi:hypothetical protein Q8F57_039720 [Paraburkholderia terrae]|uniref:hypothetical protein n=1 Tax=Paraburkholderia terrae TaxID=311230 RepID=UPI00296B2791|nr:hypothetical protein [Paraburkholderia terrae]MDW3656994.1 hypothetical protein [Paraburkholderia terrae]
MNGEQWISFLRQYGPIPTKDNLYDENLRRRSIKTGIPQILFAHPYEEQVKRCFQIGSVRGSVILTGTAGDGKTFLCGRIWEQLDGDPTQWAGQDTHLTLAIRISPTRTVRLHVLRDLSAWVPLQGSDWPEEKLALMTLFCRSFFEPEPDDIFLVAANDGQLAETLRRLPGSPDAQRAKEVVEELLVSDREHIDDASLSLFNLSRGSSARLFDLALDALLMHDGWQKCRDEAAAPDQLFGANCPIRRNVELLSEPLVRKRLRALLELCDQNGLHVPVRQILILLTNAVLGHPNVKDHVMSAADVPRVIAAGERRHASVYSNIFGGNIPVSRRTNTAIFEYLGRFQIGYETTNRIDNILIFGESHERLQQQFDTLIKSDHFYGADASYIAARRAYIEGTDEGNEAGEEFLQLLVAQRQALFFKVPESEVDEVDLWDLTVFRYGGEYLNHVLAPLSENRIVRRGLVGRLVKGINRIFTGMLVSAENELYVASSASLSQARVSRFLEERISVQRKHTGEQVELLSVNGHPALRVSLGNGRSTNFVMTLTRYEYLSRVAEGAMPSSFSKECFEDVMAFKSQLMGELQGRNGQFAREGEITFSTLELDSNGTARDRQIAVLL